ncbi:MAG: phosphoenolpyruvate carboxykinase [Armatimonadota bacterium]|nr:phosphoenolpyruvate carboxykinase [Armatimonadota bacterium]MDR7550592.1 phosphoenolpyruvate carboxykinase [Armatimonadota bacterium]
MEEGIRSRTGLEVHGIHPEMVGWNLTTPALYEHAVRRREGLIAEGGPLVVRTGHHTGRSPQDKFIVREPSSEERIWWGKHNRPTTPEAFETLHRRLLAYLQGKELFVQDVFVGADPRYRQRVRVITEYAWHSLFARTMFIVPDGEALAQHTPEFTIIDAPRFHADPETDGTRSEVFILMHLARKLVLIGGTSYAGEIKKSVFTLMNYLLPLQDVLPMHCSANVGPSGEVALFFGLSGTGKTTLSSDPERTLIGDDEHGWSDTGIFNFEGGCYAKTIRLSREGEPEIYQTTRMFGTVLENVAIDPVTRRLDLDDDSLTENTRAAYPLSFIPNASPTGLAGHPRAVVFLTADAFGVMPPIARLSADQAMYHFLAGYTAKVAGTEKGVTEPQATFSPCFGAPFMAQRPSVYAGMLGERIARHGTSVWLINTGWTGGPYGEGQRIRLSDTRAMVRAALSGALDGVPTVRDPIFGVQVPTHVPDVPPEILQPRATWRDPAKYDATARRLARMFADAFEEFAPHVSASVRVAAPRAD